MSNCDDSFIFKLYKKCIRNCYRITGFLLDYIKYNCFCKKQKGKKRNHCNGEIIIYLFMNKSDK